MALRTLKSVGVGVCGGVHVEEQGDIPEFCDD